MGDGHTHGRENAVRYKHDCDKCRSLGEFGITDLYFCDIHTPTVIARFGNEPEDYASGLELAPYVPELREARERAFKAGYLKWKSINEQIRREKNTG